MKRDIVVIRANGMKSQEIGKPLERCPSDYRSSVTSQADEILQSTSYRGFPVVRSEGDRTIIGFLRKTELAHALGQYQILSLQLSVALNERRHLQTKFGRRKGLQIISARSGRIR